MEVAISDTTIASTPPPKIQTLVFHPNDTTISLMIVLISKDYEGRNIDKIVYAMTLGANEYVIKPFDAEIIKLKLQQIGMI